MARGRFERGEFSSDERIAFVAGDNQGNPFRRSWRTGLSDDVKQRGASRALGFLLSG